jgi:hypothetical protein
MRPTLLQVQNYISNRRRAIGDNNNVADLSKYVKEKLIFDDEKTEEYELFVFGEKYGSGKDDDHFHLGFTSIGLLRQLESLDAEHTMFHIDATYRILRTNYPLIVFGFSDLSHKFHPIAFMFTSHETENDYDHFWKSFDNLCEQLRINFLSAKYKCVTFI